MGEPPMGQPLPIERVFRERRLALGLGLDAVAAVVGTTYGAISHWELGRRRMTLAYAYAYGAALGVRPVLVAGAHCPVAPEACPLPGPHMTAQARLPIVRQLRATRRQQQVTVTDLAARLWVHRVSVSSWEAGRRTLYVEQAHTYADVLGLVLTVEEISPSGSTLVGTGAPASQPSGGLR